MNELQHKTEAKNRYQPSKTVDLLFEKAVVKIKADVEKAVVKQKALLEAETASAKARVKTEAEEVLEEPEVEAKTEINEQLQAEQQPAEAEAEEQPQTEEQQAPQAEPQPQPEQQPAPQAEAPPQPEAKVPPQPEQQPAPQAEAQQHAEEQPARAQAQEQPQAEEQPAEVQAEEQTQTEEQPAPQAEATLQPEQQPETKAEEQPQTEEQPAEAQAEEQPQTEEQPVEAKADPAAERTEQEAPKNDISQQRISDSIKDMANSSATLPGDLIHVSLSMPAKEIMHTDVQWINPDQSVQTAFNMMQPHNTGYLLVGNEGELEGIISNSNIASALSPYLKPIFSKWRGPMDDATLQIRVKWIMSRPVHIIKPETPLVNVMENMCRLGMRCLPVVDQQGKVQGLVTETDIFKVLLGLKSSSGISASGNEHKEQSISDHREIGSTQTMECDLVAPV